MPATIYDLGVTAIDGDRTSLTDHAGEVMLVVNVASQCGKTPQYAGLEALYETYRGRGFAVLGFPCNQFGGQEPGTEEEIKAFCETTYGVKFPLFGKIDVKGPHQHPLYRLLTAARPERQLTPGTPPPKPAEGPDVRWNFEKFLVSRTGDIVARYDPNVVPQDGTLVKAIETELARPR